MYPHIRAWLHHQMTLLYRKFLVPSRKKRRRISEVKGMSRKNKCLGERMSLCLVNDRILMTYGVKHAGPSGRAV